MGSDRKFDKEMCSTSKIVDAFWLTLIRKWVVNANLAYFDKEMCWESIVGACLAYFD
jgi:hypothetical protein